MFCNSFSQMHSQLQFRCNYEYLGSLEIAGNLTLNAFFFFSSYRVIHCKPFTSLEPVNCQTEFTDFSGPFQLIMWKKMMHVLHTSEFTIQKHALNTLKCCCLKSRLPVSICICGRHGVAMVSTIASQQECYGFKP